MSEKQQEQPFRQLGERLKTIRQMLHESISEVSGAVEIDEPLLKRIEQGDIRPSEDILMLLISHFGMHDEEATNLWQLAGYEKSDLRDDDAEDLPVSRSTILVMAVDPRVIYSDNVQIKANKGGVVVAFSQSSGSGSTITTARIGMSREQAETVIRALRDSLDASEPRRLSDGINPTPEKN